MTAEETTGKKEEKSNKAVGYIVYVFQCSLFFDKEDYKLSLSKPSPSLEFLLIWLDILVIPEDGKERNKVRCYYFVESKI